MSPSNLCLLLVGIIYAAMIALFCLTPAHGQGIHHHPGESEIVDQFYATWLVPDVREHNTQLRIRSCCNTQDCYSTKIKYSNGNVYAERREDHAWIRIPPEKMEINYPDARDSPDGRSHVCMQSPGLADIVYCAVLGAQS